jgi:cytochrome oxidase Cu insertion factor (SCO1/SenC/PrrC family)
MRIVVLPVVTAILFLLSFSDTAAILKPEVTSIKETSNERRINRVFPPYRPYWGKQENTDFSNPDSSPLPKLSVAGNGTVINSDHESSTLHALMKNRVTVLSFVYTRCSNPKLCPTATASLAEIRRITQEHPELANRLQLLTLSFDPSNDTPETMLQYKRISGATDTGAEWLFLTATDQVEIQRILTAYDHPVKRSTAPEIDGEWLHPLRVFLIDPQLNIRSCYNFGSLNPYEITKDAQSLLLQPSTFANKCNPLTRLAQE